jgi:hypothetical protein
MRFAELLSHLSRQSPSEQRHFLLRVHALAKLWDFDRKSVELILGLDRGAGYQYD